MSIPLTSYRHDIFYLDSSSNSPPFAQTTSSSHSPPLDIHQTTSSSHSPPLDIHQTGSLSNLACSSIASLDVSRYSQSV
jgi:hypothetical protein